MMSRATLIVKFLALICISSAYARTLGKISSCGPTWMPVDDVKTNHGQIRHRGYTSAVDEFCTAANGKILGPNLYLSMATRVWLNGGEDPASNGVNGWVYFEIRNRDAKDHRINTKSCKQYLKALSQDRSKCYGKTNKDTKGGTWQDVNPNADASYHALAKSAPPDPVAVGKIFISKSEIQELGNNGKGNTLDPFPVFAYDDITPLGCHSHNDYLREYSLYSALSAGCISIEVDVHPLNGKLLIGHDVPIPNPRTIREGMNLRDLYLDPIKRLIDDRGSVFPKAPHTPLTLMVDFKSDADQSWDVLIDALKPLREAGYLSHWDGKKFVERKLTVVASGKAITGDEGSRKPIPKVVTNNPGRAVFVDAILSEDMSSFNASNAYTASAPLPNFRSRRTRKAGARQIGKEIAAAHAKGFNVRYWDIKSEAAWQQLIDEGVDLINVDRLQSVAKLDFHL